MDAAGTRLRRAVRYPNEDSDNDTPEGLDEQQQDEVITSLSQSDAETTEMYRKALLGVNLMALMFVNIRADYNAHPVYYPACIISLLISFLSAYDIYVPPSSSPDSTSSTSTFGAVDIVAMFNRGIEAGGAGAVVLRYVRDAVDVVRRYAEIANPVLCAALILIGVLGGDAGTVLLIGAPAFVVCALILVARRELKPLNVGELERLKYNYKGA